MSLIIQILVGMHPAKSITPTSKQIEIINDNIELLLKYYTCVIDGNSSAFMSKSSMLFSKNILRPIKERFEGECKHMTDIAETTIKHMIENMGCTKELLEADTKSLSTEELEKRILKLRLELALGNQKEVSKKDFMHTLDFLEISSNHEKQFSGILNWGNNKNTKDAL